MRRTNRAYNAFAHSCDDRFFSRAAHETIEMRADRDPRFDFHADTVLGDTIDRSATHCRIRCVNHFRIDARAHRFQDRLTCSLCGKVDCASPVEIERDSGLISSNQSKDHMAYITACEIMRFEWIAPNIQT